MFDEIKDLDLLVASQVEFYSSGEKKNFYDTNIINFRTQLKLHIAVFDIKKNILADESVIEVNFLSKK